jgi:hypothetical protein
MKGSRAYKGRVLDMERSCRRAQWLQADISNSGGCTSTILVAPQPRIGGIRRNLLLCTYYPRPELYYCTP